MNIDIVFKIASVGFIVLVLSIILEKAGKEHLSKIISLAGLIVALFMVVQLIGDLLVQVKSVFELS